MPHKIPVVFYKNSNYDYHFIIKELANEFGGKSECLEENTETYKNFSISIENVTKINRELQKSTKMVIKVV